MLLVLQHSDSSPLGTIGPILVDHAMKISTVRLDRNEPLPPDLDDVDAIISLGGPQCANDANPVLEREMGLLRAAHARALPVLGLCLGAQLLAKALGGEVAKLSRPEIGWHEVTLTPVGREDPLFSGIAWTSSQFHWHADGVSKLPPGARALASSKGCAVQAFGVGLRSYGIQYHPEVTEATIQRWLREGPEQLAPAATSSMEILEGTRRGGSDMARLAQRLVTNWALFVAPNDRRYRGVADTVA